MSSSRLTKNSRAVQVLRQKIEDGDVSCDDAPKAVWESDPLFKAHTLNAFRNCFNSIKSEFTAGDDPIELLDLNCKTSEDPKKKKIKTNGDEAKETITTNIGLSHIPTFIPIYFWSQWEEPRTTHQCLSLVIVLPSGIGPNDFKVRMAEEGDCVDLTVNWPKVFCDTNDLHRKWLVPGRLSDVHPKILGFEKILKKLGNNATGIISSTARIGLPLTVEAHMDGKYNIGWRDDDTIVLYVDLKSVLNEYDTQNDNSTLEIF